MANAANHHAVDIINVLSIVRHAKVSQWIEADNDGITDALYWRQAFDYRTSQLSTFDLLCRCQTPANPDKTLFGCTSSDCGQWMHIDCLREDVLKRVHDRLGTDQPYVPAMKMTAIGTLDCSPLDWWSRSEQKSRLHAMAITLLSIPAESSEPKRAFSRSRRTYS